MDDASLVLVFPPVALELPSIIHIPTLSRSHGKEKLGNKPDVAKASYYFNPISDT